MGDTCERVCTYLCRPDVNVRYLFSHSLPYFFDTRSLNKHVSHGFNYIGWLTYPRDLVSILLAQELQVCIDKMTFFMIAGDMNSGPRVCKARVLPVEPCH